MNREVSIWRKLNHPNIAICYGICYLNHRPALVLAWYENGTASDYLKGKVLSEKLRIVICLYVLTHWRTDRLIGQGGRPSFSIYAC